MKYMIIETFKGGDPLPIYRRARQQGRMIPDGLTFVDSWVDAALSRCFQVMECDEPTLLDTWIENWSDLVDFEVIEVLSTTEVVNQLETRL